MAPHLKSIFALLVAALLITTGWIAYRELNPQWKAYQRVYYQREAAKVRQALAGADQDRRQNLEKRLRYLTRPDYRIRQILLDDGRRADRCVTCHLDPEQLAKTHPQVKRFPFEQYGCTVCHGGIGRATEKSRAHSTLRIPRRPLQEYLQARQSKTNPLDLFNFGADGRPIQFTGSQLCLRCHLGSHPRHVARWRQLKFQPLARVQNKLKELHQTGIAVALDQCLACHTTGYNALQGSYVEDRVTCESCHGPGGFYADLMAGGKAREGAQLARASLLESQAERVCLNCHRPDRHDSYLNKDVAPVLTAAYLDDAPAPVLDGQAGDAAWQRTVETHVPTWQLGDGPPQPGTAVAVRAVYDRKRIYFVFRWSDPNRQTQLGRWISRESHWQVAAVWPDALALDWSTTEKVADFQQGGCAVLCHTTGRFADFPRMATRQDDAIVDEWYWNAYAARRAARPGDGFLDSRVDYIAPATPVAVFGWVRPGQSAAHGSDTSGARLPDVLGGLPLIPNARQVQGKVRGPAFRLQSGQRVPVDPTEAAGPRETLPLFASGRPEQGDSADIDGRAVWAGGYWTLEMGRPLRTSSSRDIQFDPAQIGTTFGLALWNGSTGDRHQVATKVSLRFQAPGAANPSAPAPVN
jgi:Ethylbenzene dehydrogenase/Cytochrome c554 and c-prime